MNIAKLQIHHLDVVRFGEGDYFLNSHGDDFLSMVILAFTAADFLSETN